MHVLSLTKDKEGREKLKNFLWQHSELLKEVFRHYSASGEQDDDINHMNNMEFWTLCQRCKIPSQLFSLSSITKIFRKFNFKPYHYNIMHIPHQYMHVCALDQVNLNSIGDTGDEDNADRVNPDNQFDRAEFYEGLISLAMRKYTGQGAADALDSLIRFHIEPYALHGNERDSIRDEIREELVQLAFRRRNKELRNLYGEYCNKGDDNLSGKDLLRARTTINFQEFKMLINVLILSSYSFPLLTCLYVCRISRSLSTVLLLNPLQPRL